MAVSYTKNQNNFKREKKIFNFIILAVFNQYLFLNSMQIL